DESVDSTFCSQIDTSCCITLRIDSLYLYSQKRQIFVTTSSLQNIEKRQNSQKSTKIEPQIKEIVSNEEDESSSEDSTNEEASVNDFNQFEGEINKASYTKEMLSTKPIVKNSANKVSHTNIHTETQILSMVTMNSRVVAATMLSSKPIVKNLANKVSHTNIYMETQPLSMVTTDLCVTAVTSPSDIKLHVNNFTYLIDNETFEYDSPQSIITKLLDTSNEFEIALWMAQHPRTLNLATLIHNAIRTQASTINNNNKLLFNTVQSCNSLLNAPEINTSQSCNSMLNIPEHTKLLLLEECKALFLYTRNNMTKLYEELISQECKITKIDCHMLALFKKKETLHLHLKGTDLIVLKKDIEMLKKLDIFVFKAVKAVIIAIANNQDTRIVIQECDEYTINLKIPTKLEVVKSLPVRDLLSR
ncbi:15662_t:CDS:2, partial [Racocetra persica]